MTIGAGSKRGELEDVFEARGVRREMRSSS